MSEPVANGADFTQFYELRRESVRNALALALGDVGLADEAVDEAMTRALARWDSVGTYDKPEGWVYRVGLNWATDLFRRRRYELLTELDPQGNSTDSPDLDPDLIEAVGRLSMKLRSVVVARYYLDWTTTAVADALEIPEGTVKSRLSRALSLLAEDLGGSR